MSPCLYGAWVINSYFWLLPPGLNSVDLWLYICFLHFWTHLPKCSIGFKWNNSVGTYLTFPDCSSASIFCFSYPKWRPSSIFEFFLYVSHRPAHLIPVPPFCQQVPRPINSASVISFVYVSSSVFSWGRHFSLLWTIAKFLQLLPLPPVSFPTNPLYIPPLKFFPKYSLIKKIKVSKNICYFTIDN